MQLTPRRIGTLLGLAFGILVFSSYSEGPFFYGAGNRTGSAGSPVGCSEATGCHSSAAISAVLNVQLLDSTQTVVTQYRPGSTYRVLLSELVPGTDKPRFGFQASIVQAADGSTTAGNVATGGNSYLSVFNVPPQLIEHNQPLMGTPSGSDILDTVSFLWTAPAAGFGRVRIYAVLNAVNYNGDSTGDRWRATTAEFDPIPTSVAQVQPKAAGRVFPNPVRNSVQVTEVEAYSLLEVCDVLGRPVLQGMANALGRAQLDFSSLPAGRYFLESKTNAGRQVWPLMKE